MNKKIQFALVAPASQVIVMDFGQNKDLMEKYIEERTAKYGSPPAAVPRKVTTIKVMESVDTLETNTVVGITLLHSSSLVLTNDGNIAVHDRHNDLYTSVGPANISTLNAIIDAAERLKAHVK